MRLALISDIHANLEALEAVLRDIETADVEKIHCLGDVIGYGCDPVACLRLVQDHCEIKLMGNHEYAALGLLPPSQMNNLARQSMEWTVQVITDQEIAIMAEFEMDATTAGVYLVHASPCQPDSWPYILSETEARQAFPCFSQKITFFGHTHLPMVFSLAPGDSLRGRVGHDLDFDDDVQTRHLINIGSVGQPRDVDPRACYVVFDGEEGSVTYRRVEYDIKATQAKMIRAQLPQQLIERLEVGR